MSDVEELDISRDLDILYDSFEKPQEVQELDISRDLDLLYDSFEEQSKLSDDEQIIKDDLYYSVFADEAFKDTKKRDNIDDYKYLKKASNDFVATYKNDDKKEVVIAYKGTDFKKIFDELKTMNPFAENKKLLEKYKERINDPSEQKSNPLSQLLMDIEIFSGSLNPVVGGLGSLFAGLSGVEIFNQKNVIDKIKELYPDYNTIFTGFSLGGALARRSHERNAENSRAITFNGATGISPLFGETLPFTGDDFNIKNYRIKNDLVSRTGLAPGDLITLEPKKSVLDNNKDSYFPSHTIKHFIKRKDFKTTSGLEIGDNPLSQLFTSDEVFKSFNNIFNLPDVIKSPQLIMGFLNNMSNYIDKPVKTTNRFKSEPLRNRIGRKRLLQDEL